MDAAGEPGYGFVRLNQLAIEHLLRAPMTRARRRSRLVDAVVQGRDPGRGDWCAGPGRARAASGRHRGRSGALVARAGCGGGAGRRARRRGGGFGGRAAARHGLPRRARVRWSGRRCCGTTPGRPGRPRTWSPSWAAAMPGKGRPPGRTRSAACRWPRSRSPSCGGWPTASRTRWRAPPPSACRTTG